MMKATLTGSFMDQVTAVHSPNPIHLIKCIIEPKHIVSQQPIPTLHNAYNLPLPTIPFFNHSLINTPNNLFPLLIPHNPDPTLTQNILPQDPAHNIRHIPPLIIIVVDDMKITIPL